MRNLINFLLRFSSWIIFIIYVVISCVLLFQNNPYQHHIYLTSAGKLSSTLYEWRNGFTSYFHLKDINEDLVKHNASLELEVISLRNKVRQLQQEQYADTMHVIPSFSQYEFIIAHVINNSITQSHNFITIDKGLADGVQTEMGVLDHNGVVGIVNIAGENNSRIISILNPDLRLSCKIKGSDNFGSLVWDGESHEKAILEELPRHAVVNTGDTIVTSGYSSVFPEGIPVGTVISREDEDDDNFFALKIKLLADFARLGTIKIVKNNMKDEIKSIEGK